MAHGPVNQAWRVCVHQHVDLLRITKDDYDTLRNDYPDIPICVLRDGNKVTKIVRMDNPSGEELSGMGWENQNGRTWYQEMNVTVREYDE